MGVTVRNQASFSLGEVDKAFWRQFELEEYWKACKQANNVIVTALGSVTKRPGTQKQRNVTSLITDPSIRYDLVYLQATTGEIITVEYILVGNVIKLSANGADFESITLTGYTSAQAQKINFVAVAESLILLNAEVAPHRIAYDGTNFSLADYTIDRAPCFDFGKVNYYAATNVSISLNGDKDTVITLNVYFPDIADWVKGTITGPGTDATSNLGFGIIKAATSTETPASTTFTLTTMTAFDTSNDIKLSGYGLVIEQPVMTDALGYPSTGVYFQDRLWLSGHPKLQLTTFGSKVGIVSNFDTGIGYATDGVTITQQISDGKILYLVVGKHLEMFSEKAQFSTPGSDEGLTPANTSYKKQSSYAVSLDCTPIAFQNFTFFSGNDGDSIYSFIENEGVEESYRTELISTYSTHLVKNPVKLKVFTGSSQTLYLLAILNGDDKSLTIFQYNEASSIRAWTSFSFHQDVEIIDIGSTTDDLYILMKYNLTSQYVIERLKANSISYVDSSIPVSLTAGASPIEVTGLSDLNGYMVSVSNETTYLGDYLVEDGKIYVNFTKPGATFEGFVGLKYFPILSPLSLVGDPGLAYNFKSVDKIYVDYADSLAIVVNGVEIPYQTFEEIQSGGQLTLKSGTYELSPMSGWDLFQDIVITQSAPVAWRILSLAYRLTEGIL